MVVDGDVRDTEPILAYMTVRCFQESAPGVQEPRALYEECAKCHRHDVGESELAVCPGTGVGQSLEDGPQFTDQIVGYGIRRMCSYRKPPHDKNPNQLFL